MPSSTLSSTATRRPAILLDLVGVATAADWRSGSGIRTFGSLLPSVSGCARRLQNMTLEDGLPYARSLKALPQQVSGGYITCSYAQLVSLRERRQ